MKNRCAVRWMLAVALLAIVGVSLGRAGEFAIQSFDGTGQLTFNEIEGAEAYRVEWAPAPGGPWTNFTGAAGAALDEIMAKGSGIVTCSVPMCYRVVALMASPPGMVLIPGGTNAGTDPDYGSYSLTVSSFHMDKYEVTKAQWDVVYNWAVSHGYSFDNPGSGKAADHPVHTVNWYDCVKWCNARSEKDGRTPCYTVSGNVYRSGQNSLSCNFNANGYRLPTNTEWEYAARGGLSGKRFPWGDTITHSRANYYSNAGYSYDVSSTRGYHPDYDDGGYPYTSPVGDFSPNGYELYDMAGNVWEWCNDASGSTRYIRGGSWDYFAYSLRCGYDERLVSSASRHSTYGFRAVCR